MREVCLKFIERAGVAKETGLAWLSHARWLVPISCLLLVSCASVQSGPDAEHAAQRWLALVDAGSYEMAWDRATGAIRSRPKEQWVTWMRERRKGLGLIEERRRVCIGPAPAQVPEAPGTYMQIEYEVDFNHGLQHVFEYIKLKQIGASTWLVSWHFVRQKRPGPAPICTLAQAHS